MGDAEFARLARLMGVPLEDASAIYAQAAAEAPFDPARALTRYVELLHGSRSADAPRRPGWPGKRALTTRISSGSQPRRDHGRSWPGQHALTSRLAAAAAAQYALRSAEPNASPDDHVDAPLDQALRYSRGGTAAAPPWAPTFAGFSKASSGNVSMTC